MKPRGTIRTLAGLDGPLRSLFFSTLLYRAGTMAFPFLAAYLLAEGELDAVAVGLVVGAFGLGALVADLCAGLVLGWVRPVAVMLTGAVAYPAVLTVVPALSGQVPLLVAAFLWGLFFEIYTPAAYSQIAFRSSPQERKVAFSCNRLAINVGMAIGPAVGGLLFTLAPVALFYVNAGCVLAAAALLLRMPSDRGVGPAEREPFRLISPTRRDEARFWTVFLLALPVHVAYALPPVFLSTYVVQRLDLPAYWVSAVFVTNALVILLFEVPLNNAMADVSHLWSLMIGFALAAAGFLLMGLTDHGVTLVLVSLVWTVGEMIVFPSLFGYISHLSPASVTQRNVSLFAAGANVGFLAAPQVGAALDTPSAPGLPWVAAGAAVGAATVLVLVARASPRTWCPEPTPVTSQQLSEVP